MSTVTLVVPPGLGEIIGSDGVSYPVVGGQVTMPSNAAGPALAIGCFPLAAGQGVTGNTGATGATGGGSVTGQDITPANVDVVPDYANGTAILSDTNPPTAAKWSVGAGATFGSGKVTFDVAAGIGNLTQVLADYAHDYTPGQCCRLTYTIANKSSDPGDDQTLGFGADNATGSFEYELDCSNGVHTLDFIVPDIYAGGVSTGFVAGGTQGTFDLTFAGIQTATGGDVAVARNLSVAGNIVGPVASIGAVQTAEILSQDWNDWTYHDDFSLSGGVPTYVATGTLIGDLILPATKFSTPILAGELNKVVVTLSDVTAGDLSLRFIVANADDSSMILEGDQPIPLSDGEHTAVFNIDPRYVSAGSYIFLHGEGSTGTFKVQTISDKNALGNQSTQGSLSVGGIFRAPAMYVNGYAVGVGFNLFLLIAGGAAGDLACPGMQPTTSFIQSVLQFTAGALITDLKDEFTPGTDVINNAGGTNTTGSMLFVIWQNIIPAL